MSLDAHRQAEVLMGRADTLVAEGRAAEARDLYTQAAELEAKALESIPATRPRTRGIIAVSAVALYRRGGAIDEVTRHARRYLAERGLPEFARAQLAELLDDARRQQQARAVG
jgi:hypothetical protein